MFSYKGLPFRVKKWLENVIIVLRGMFVSCFWWSSLANTFDEPKASLSCTSLWHSGGWYIWSSFQLKWELHNCHRFKLWVSHSEPFKNWKMHLEKITDVPVTHQIQSCLKKAHDLWFYHRNYHWDIITSLCSHTQSCMDMRNGFKYKIYNSFLCQRNCQNTPIRKYWAVLNSKMEIIASMNNKTCIMWQNAHQRRLVWERT